MSVVKSIPRIVDMLSKGGIILSRWNADGYYVSSNGLGSTPKISNETFQAMLDARLLTQFEFGKYSLSPLGWQQFLPSPSVTQTKEGQS